MLAGIHRPLLAEQRRRKRRAVERDARLRSASGEIDHEIGNAWLERGMFLARQRHAVAMILGCVGGYRRAHHAEVTLGGFHEAAEFVESARFAQAQRRHVDELRSLSILLERGL